MTCHHTSAGFSMMEDMDLEIVRHNNINTIVAIITIITITPKSSCYTHLRSLKWIYNLENEQVPSHMHPFHAHLHLWADRYATHSVQTNKRPTNGWSYATSDKNWNVFSHGWRYLTAWGRIFCIYSERQKPVSEWVREEFVFSVLFSSFFSYSFSQSIFCNILCFLALEKRKLRENEQNERQTNGVTTAKHLLQAFDLIQIVIVIMIVIHLQQRYISTYNHIYTWCFLLSFFCISCNGCMIARERKRDRRAANRAFALVQTI